jgi:hypothetical protein
MMDDFTTAEIQTGETSIFVRSHGSGPPLLLLHGFPQTHLMWLWISSSAPLSRVISQHQLIDLEAGKMKRLGCSDGLEQGSNALDD